MMTYSQPEAVIIQSAILLLAFIMGLRETWLLTAGQASWWPLQPSRVPSLPVPWPWLAAFLVVVPGLALAGLQFLSIFLGVLAILWMIWQSGRSPERLWGFRSTRWGLALQTGIRCYLGILIPISVIGVLSLLVIQFFGGTSDPQQAIQLFMEAETTVDIINLCIFAVVIAPVVEEFIFRGFLYPVLKSHLGRGAALGVTALLFGISHAHGLAFLPLTALGLVLGLVYDQSGRLGYPILLHGIFNSVTCAMIVFERYAG